MDSKQAQVQRKKIEKLSSKTNSTFWQKFCGLAPIKFLSKIFCRKHKKDEAQKSHEMRDHMSEKQIDKNVENTFPASDPPSTY